MTQLTYNAAFDSYHTIFRIFRARHSILVQNDYALDTVRIIDFFLMFPYKLQNFSFKTEDLRFRSVSKKFERLKPYGDQPIDWTIFSRMEDIQRASLSTLSEEGYLDADALIDGRVEFLSKDIPASLSPRIEKLAVEDQELMEALKTLVSDYSLTGSGGLKRRSGLLEHKYDAA